jgi:endonuclease YncB( thermonuclease family)
MSTKVAGWLSVIAAAALFAACNGMSDSDTATSASTAGSGTRATAAAPTVAPQPVPTVAPAAQPVGERITVARVNDGESFELTDGRTVRVLGIDSCEMDTYGGGEAKLAAETQLQNEYNEPIIMSAEPGAPDTDRNGRLLRYISLNGSDFGEHMVKYDHTGVYQGDNDASDAYIQRLYAADLEYAMNPPSGRECADPYAEYRDDVDVHVDVNNDDDHNSRDGSIIPACRHKWWC